MTLSFVHFIVSRITMLSPTIKRANQSTQAFLTPPFKSFYRELAAKLDIRMYNPHVPRERIVSQKCFLLHAQMAADLLLAIVMNCILVPSKVVRAQENVVAGHGFRYD